MEEIKVTIAKDGSITIDVDGVKGSMCKEMTKSLEQALGMTIKNKKNLLQP